ncbi:Ubiquitin-protein ligase E3A [Verticillium dahliae VDG2]|nr:Ubiquitin-protein ligase E3A [Verticillium dahliae VDG2]
MSDAKRCTHLTMERNISERPQDTSPKPSGAEEQPAGLRSPFLNKQTQEKARAEVVPVIIGSPWKYYKSRYRLKCGYFFAVVTSTTSRLPRMIRSTAKPSTAEQLQLLQHLRHPNIVESLELYTCPQEGYFLVSEFLPTTVRHLCQAPIYPTEPELSSILYQVLTGIDFLLGSGLIYEQISAANLLMSSTGEVKICDVERCTSGGDVSKLLGSFTRLMMKLMDKKKLEDSVPSLTRPGEWSTDAIDMFTASVSASPVIELLGQPFLRKREQKDLVWLVQFVLVRARHFPE